MMTIVVGALLFIGAFLMFVAAVGLLRMPDVLLRLSTTTKAVTLGAGCALAAAALHFHEHVGIITRVVATIVFLAATAPVAAHMLARATYFAKVPLWKGTRVDELRDNYDEPAGRAARRQDDSPLTDSTRNRG